MHFGLSFSRFPDASGPVCFALVPWDSELYGFPVYELRYEGAALQTLRKYLPLWLSSLPHDNACLVYSKVPQKSIDLVRSLTDFQFYPVETVLEISVPLSRFATIVKRQDSHGCLRQAQDSDLPRIRALASSAFACDRFHLDSNLPVEIADKRYSQWVERGFRAGEPLFIYEDVNSSSVIGFFHVREVLPGTVDLSLAAVATPYQGSGLGAMMYQAVLLECKARGFKVATTRISINNLDIVNVFARLGFTFRNALLTLHRYMPRSTVRQSVER